MRDVITIIIIDLATVALFCFSCHGSEVKFKVASYYAQRYKGHTIPGQKSTRSRAGSALWAHPGEQAFHPHLQASVTLPDNDQDQEERGMQIHEPDLSSSLSSVLIQHGKKTKEGQRTHVLPGVPSDQDLTPDLSHLSWPLSVALLQRSYQAPWVALLTLPVSISPSPEDPLFISDLSSKEKPVPQTSISPFRRFEDAAHPLCFSLGFIIFL